VGPLVPVFVDRLRTSTRMNRVSNLLITHGASPLGFATRIIMPSATVAFSGRRWPWPAWPGQPSAGGSFHLSGSGRPV
jgi:hypothetical protein